MSILPEATENSCTDFRSTEQEFYAYPFPVEPWNEPAASPSYGVIRWQYFQKKYFRERVIGSLLLAIVTPIILMLWCLVRLTSKGAGFFKQTRVGYRGQPFEMIKLRTMVADAEADGRARWCVKGDPRITWLGRILRKTHMDELPQLINVARGEMALVGPRPERPCFVEQLKQKIDGYERRLSVLPGITGLAQINLPPDETIDDVRRKQHLDLLYIRETNFWLDLRMLMGTAIRLFGIPGEIVIRALGLRRTIPAALCREGSVRGIKIAIDPEPNAHGSQKPLAASIVRIATLRYPQPPRVRSLPSFVPNAFTVDVEDYFHVSGFSDCVSPRDWDWFPCRVEANTLRLLDMLQRKKVRGTFFILGWVADRYPKLIRRIAEEGHELGCHSYWHRLVYQMTPQEFLDDLRKARSAIEQAAGTGIQLYRAPSFSITPSSLWAIDILSEEGFVLDSSIFPMKHHRYGMPESTSAIHHHQGIVHSIDEYPPTVWKSGILNVPVGGGYFRLIPRWLTQMAIDRTRRSGIPAMFYIHPWEIDPKQPRVEGIRFANRLRHSIGLQMTYAKLSRLLEENRFAAIGDVVKHFDMSTATNDLPLEV